MGDRAEQPGEVDLLLLAEGLPPEQQEMMLIVELDQRTGDVVGQGQRQIVIDLDAPRGHQLPEGKRGHGDSRSIPRKSQVFHGDRLRTSSRLGATPQGLLSSAAGIVPRPIA
jgi:hypothetical protein